MEKEFIPYEQALALKELGFDEPCFGYFEPNKKFKYLNWETFKDFPYLAKNSEWQDLYGAPTFSQAFRWFRDKCGLELLIAKDDIGQYYFSVKKSEALFDEDDYCFKTYEEAELECLNKLIEIVKNKK
tara:strand:- start:827 stop:1210 length:384 start_codon:yes stop_codon:yes gene_type:complete